MTTALRLVTGKIKVPASKSHFPKTFKKDYYRYHRNRKGPFMKINVVSQLHHHRTGEPLWKDKQNGLPLTLRDICVGSLNGCYPQDASMAGYENGVRRSYIADLFEEREEVEIGDKEIALVKKAVGLNFPDPILLRAVDNALSPVVPAPVKPPPVPKAKAKKKKK